MRTNIRVFLILFIMSLILFLGIVSCQIFYFERGYKQNFVTGKIVFGKAVTQLLLADIQTSSYLEIYRLANNLYEPKSMLYLAIIDISGQTIHLQTNRNVGQIQSVRSKIKSQAIKQELHILKEPVVLIRSPIVDEEGKQLGGVEIAYYWAPFKNLLRNQFFTYAIFFLVFVFIWGLFFFFSIKSILNPLDRFVKNLKNIQSEWPISLKQFNMRLVPQKVTSDMKVLLDLLRTSLLKLLEYEESKQKNTALAAIGQSTAMIAHDIRNPLSVIKSFFENDNRNNEEYVEAARRSTQKLRSIVDNLLDYSKASKIAKTRFDLANAVNVLKNEWRYLINGKDIQIEYAGPDTLTVDLDQEKIGRVLGNLVANSIQALESKGLIKIELSSDAKNCLKIKVADNGKGIQKEDLPKLFELLFTKGKEGGTGLGLSYCKQVIEAHGGEITVESELGQGTTFTITIPDCVVKEQDVLELDKKISGKTNTRGKNQIMVIDDDKDILKKWEILIREKGFEPITLTTTEGISKFDFSKVETAIVDYKFNGSHLSGFDIIEFLQMKKIPKIHLCTAFFDDPSIKQKVIDMGITSLIPKPIPKDLPF